MDPRHNEIGITSRIFNLYQSYNPLRLKLCISIILILVIYTLLPPHQSVVEELPQSMSKTTTETTTSPTTTTALFREGQFYQNIAVIAESRPFNQLIAVVHNVLYHTPPTWPVQIFYSNSNIEFIKNSTLKPYIQSGRIILTLLHRNYDREEIKYMLTDAKFWQQVRGEKILFFQTDAVMCSNSPHKVTDFIQYDYVGAPWDTSIYPYDQRYRVGNGGFSIRSRSKTLALIAHLPYDPAYPEDIWYALNFHLVNASIPSIEIAMTFSVESMFYERPVGVHRFPWHCKFRADLARVCPESVMVMPDVCRP